MHADRTACGGSERGVMAGKMPNHASNDSALDAASGLGAVYASGGAYRQADKHNDR
jgi:hypothetical protein